MIGCLLDQKHFLKVHLKHSSKIVSQVVKAAQGRVPVFVDCGIRRGTDVFKALALGASGVFVSINKRLSKTTYLKDLTRTSPNTTYKLTMLTIGMHPQLLEEVYTFTVCIDTIRI